MVDVEYPDTMRVADARRLYFRANGFGDDGGYSKKVEWIPLGPVRVPVPNIDARVRALRFHDIHHVLTDYRTDWRGEFQISAWELGAGCRDAWFAWLINMGGLLAGLIILPRRTLRAFLRGRHSRSLYDLNPLTLEDELLGDLRRRAQLDSRPARWSPGDVMALIAITLLSLLWALLQLAVLLAPLALVLWLVLA